MVNWALSAFVVDCNEHTLKLCHEQKIYVAEKNKETARKKKGLWVWFKVDKENPMKVVESGSMPRQWNSRVADDGEVLLDVNAVIRNVREFPDIEGATFPHKAWSAELEFIEDSMERFSYKKGYRLGKMHDLTVKVLVAENNDVSFDITEVRYESPTDVQLDMGYAPWIAFRLNNLPPIVDQTIEPVRNREFGKVNSRSRDFGLIVRERDGKMLVWSNDSGQILVDTPHNFKIGDFVQFRRSVQTRFNRMVAADLVRGSRVARTKAVWRNSSLCEALVEVLLKVPKKEDFYKNSYIVHKNIFLGTVKIRVLALREMLKKEDMLISEVFGKSIRAWAGPTTMAPCSSSSHDNEHFWEIEELCENPLELDDVDDLSQEMATIEVEDSSEDEGPGKDI